MTSGRAPTERRSLSASDVISKSTPRRSICCTSSCVVSPLILTASINPFLVMGFFAVCAAAATQTSAAQAAAIAAWRTLLLLETACVDMSSTSGFRLTLHPAVALDEVDDELRLFGLLRQRGEVVVLVV